MMFTDEEALALAMGLLAVRGLSASPASAAVESARSKLERVLPAKLRARLGVIDESVTLELTQPIAALNPNVLARMTAAAQERVRVALVYRTPQGAQTRREFDPYGLVYRAGRWYSVGMCHLRGGLRSFRLDRITEATLLAPRFDRPAGFDALEYLKASIATLPRTYTIEVMLETDLASAQRQLFSALGTLEWTGEGVLLRSQADDIDWFARELSRLPFDFRVRSPRQLATAVGAAGRRLIRMGRAGNRA
jgi:predicted DNA-binding transcriptional regulator YafY